MDRIATVKQYMNGEIFTLKNPLEFICRNQVRIFRNANWLIIQISSLDHQEIEKQARNIMEFKNSPLNEEGKCFVPLNKMKTTDIWTHDKMKADIDLIPMGASGAQVKLVLNRFTKYNNQLAFKLDVSDIILDNNNSLCPF